MDLDWSALSNALETKKTVYEFESHAPYFEKVALDRYKSKNGSGQLWELRENEDGKKYLYALYDEPEDVITVQASLKKWSAVPTKTGQSITLFYNDSPVYKFAADVHGFGANEASDFARFVENKVKDDAWREAFFSKAMPKDRLAKVLKLINGD